MDSRVYPNNFVSLDSGDAFMVRNAGNFIPHACDFEDYSRSISTEPGALEMACCRNQVQNIVICGHSDCNVMFISFIAVFPIQSLF